MLICVIYSRGQQVDRDLPVVAKRLDVDREALQFLNTWDKSVVYFFCALRLPPVDRGRLSDTNFDITLQKVRHPLYTGCSD